MDSGLHSLMLTIKTAGAYNILRMLSFEKLLRHFRLSIRPYRHLKDLNRKLLESLEISPMDEEWLSVLNADWDRATSSSDSDSPAPPGHPPKRGRN
ncbi:hypothetical protein CASFOL_009491 [Castilleja foliolosa]|uniref:Uncharacterized protein n=1 Tax=Castilleja foliolosa TaxID=1961234 RepID=A0ABD3DY25_9LAMI